jgi:hypothetical protein
MRKGLAAALGGGVMLAAFGAVAPSQAAVIDFGVLVVQPPDVSYTGANLQTSTAFDLGSATLRVNTVASGDKSGLAVGDDVSIAPTDLMYGTSPFPSFTKSWTDSLGTFTETLNKVVSINRATTNAITVDFSGVLNGPGFTNAPAMLIFTANQAAGPGGTITASFTETAASVIPEPSTWAMMLAGFAGLGFVGFRSRRSQRLEAIF